MEKKNSESNYKLQSSFLENMSHEIRTPMNTVIGFSSLLAAPEISDNKRKEYSSMIYQSSVRLLKFLDDLIDLEKIESNNISIIEGACQVNLIINELFHTFNEVRKKMGLKYVSLRINNECINDDIIIQSDKYRIRQVLGFLIENALRYTDIGNIEIGFRYKKEELEFYVQDSGIGISKTHINEIFKKYYQVNKSDKKRYRGIGIGLYISYELAKLLGGSISVSSTLGKGSTFYLKLPLLKLEEIPKEIPRFEIDIEDLNWENKTILIAEDEKMNYRLLKEILTPTKAKIISVQNGEHAVEICKSNRKIDIVLMDIQMPILNGYDATRQIKHFNKKIPIIAQTAYAHAGEKAKSISAGCDDYISKPIDPKTLLYKINKYFN
ncbi:MAG: response regulator [Bacteroidetes bacterium]|nr:response regulator [Bacteroidota bacterium]MBT6684793.1 response regulator [Bacteroidota bacterium]MBT7141769.1 response regulator [Bacteroidota bacterium]MBT7490737.1 response regulator [Bacteroidota bacterium]